MTLELQTDPSATPDFLSGTVELPTGLEQAGAPIADDGAEAGPDCFRIVRQLSVGPDGVAYEALDLRTSERVEYWKLNDNKNQPGRKAEILRRLRLVGLLRNRAAWRIRETFQDSQHLIVIVDSAPSQSLLDWESTASCELDELRLLQAVVRLLAEAHQLGLTHEQLHPHSIRLTADGAPRIDFSRLQLDGSVNSPDAAAFLADVDAPFDSHDPANDVFSLGKLVQWCFETRYDLESRCREQSARRTAELKQLAQSSIFDPAVDRPALSRYLDCLSAFVDTPDTTDRQGTCELRSANVGEPQVQSDTTNELSSNLAPADSTAEIVPPPIVGDSTTDMGLLGPVPTQKQNAHTMSQAGETLGRFEIVKKIGEGGMGVVYKATDVSDGTIVAIKVLSQSASLRSNALQRFHKEARLLASVNNPHVANLIEVNEQDGLHYIVLEFVEGVDLKHVLAENSPLGEDQALAVAADVARALVDAHQREIVHRDIKPENILLEFGVAKELGKLSASANMPPAKLTDFGIARHVDQSESLAVTQAGGILGTPMYMSPEQCKGNGEVSPQSDVYSLGITLYEMLTGRAPFQADDPMKLAGMHCFDAPPKLRKLNPQVSEVVASIVEKAIAKKPGDRYADAAHILRDLDQALRGEPSDLAVHPLLPSHDPQQVISNTMTWQCKSTPEQLWPLVANTDRLNRAMGLPAVNYTTRADEHGKVRRYGAISLAGFEIAWEEHPFEWVEGKRMSVLREFTSGPFVWFMSTVELKNLPEGDTLLTHCVKILPRNLVGKMLAKVEAGAKCQRSLDKVYTRIDRTLSGENGDSPLVDPFEAPASLPKHQQTRLQQRMEQLIENGVDVNLVQQLGEYIAMAPAQELAKIRPLELAARLHADSQQLTDACLQGSTLGLFNLQWDILCPTCRVAADTQNTLKELEGHTHCEACNTEFESDVANAVEMVFRVNSDLRETEHGKYCIGGPGHSPHVVAQVRVEPDERVELELNLPSGEYLLRGPQLAKSITIKVQAEGAPSQQEFTLNSELDNRMTAVLRAGKQLLWITNEFDGLQVIRLERTIPRSDVITAAQASALPLFRKLFPGEILDSGRLISTEQVTLLVTTLPEVDTLYIQLGDTAAYELVQRHLESVQEKIQSLHGAVIKTVGEGVVAAFDQVEAAVKAAFELIELEDSAEAAPRLVPSVGVHRGPALVTTVNDRLDYFGATARIATALPSVLPGISLSESVISDPSVHELLANREDSGELKTVDLPGKPNQIIQYFAHGEDQ